MEENTNTGWVRVRAAAEQIGIRGARLYELLNEVPGSIKVCKLKSPGSQRGAILIYMPSLLAYLDNLSEEQAQERETAPSYENLEPRKENNWVRVPVVNNHRGDNTSGVVDNKGELSTDVRGANTNGNE